MKFTKGPWIVLPEEKDKPYIRVRGTALGLKYKIANVPYILELGPNEIAEAKEIANLIAAAPHMYHALLQARHTINTLTRDASDQQFAQVAHFEIDEALNKANGKA